MNADIKGALDYIERGGSVPFEHRDQKMTKNEVKHVLTRAKEDGYKTTGELPNEKVDFYLQELVSAQLQEKPKAKIFRANFNWWHGSDIEEFTVISQTSRTVTISQGRFNIFSQSHSFYETWEEAKEALLEFKKAELNKAKSEYEKLKEKFEYLTNLQKP